MSKLYYRGVKERASTDSPSSAFVVITFITMTLLIPALYAAVIINLFS